MLAHTFYVLPEGSRTKLIPLRKPLLVLIRALCASCTASSSAPTVFVEGEAFQVCTFYSDFMYIWAKQERVAPV